MAGTWEAWIDTGFTGTLLLTADQVNLLGLERTAVVPGTLADGSRTLFETYASEVEWLGEARAVEAIAGTGRFALLDIGLLQDLTLRVDYPARTVTLQAGSAVDG